MSIHLGYLTNISYEEIHFENNPFRNLDITVIRLGSKFRTTYTINGLLPTTKFHRNWTTRCGRTYGRTYTDRQTVEDVCIRLITTQKSWWPKKHIVTISERRGKHVITRFDVYGPHKPWYKRFDSALVALLAVLPVVHKQMWVVNADATRVALQTGALRWVTVLHSCNASTMPMML